MISKDTRDLIRLVPWTTIDGILAIDAEVYQSNPKLFCEQNRVNYDLAINSWVIAIRDYAPYTWVNVVSKLSTAGLMQTVHYFTDAANALLSEGSLDAFQLAKSLYQEIAANFELRNRIPAAVYQTSLSVEGVTLFLFRYLKRFTPLQAKQLEYDAVTGFCDNQRRLKKIARRGYSPFILQFIRDEIECMTDVIAARTMAFRAIRLADVEITPGVSYSLAGEKLSTLQSKLDSLNDEYGYYRRENLHRSAWDYILGGVARLQTVPKTLFSARTIAPEELLRQSIARRMFSLCVGNTPDGINLRDQSVNQQMAYQGSITGQYCTIDLSHASDDVTWLLVQELYREYPEYLHYLGLIRPKYIEVQYKDAMRKGSSSVERLLLQSFATMGNSMTFLIESEVFWLITRAAVHFAQGLGIPCSDDVYVYGDDIICANEAYDCVVWFLQRCGFSINAGKSYCSGGFRESCGKDYWNGQDVSSPYFPRRRLTTLLDWSRNKNGDLITVAESLISLQHRLFDVSRGAAQYIELYIRSEKDGLGTEPIGSSTVDLWGGDLIPAGTRLIPEGKWLIHEHLSTWHVDGTELVICRETWSLMKAWIDDDMHRVEMQLRPAVTVETLPYNEEYLLNQYLQHGPYYVSPLDELLGVSTSRRLIPNGRPRSTWKKFER